MDPRSSELSPREIEAVAKRALRLAEFALKAGASRGRWLSGRSNYSGTSLPGDMMSLKGTYILGIFSALVHHAGPLDGAQTFFKDEQLLNWLRDLRSRKSRAFPDLKFSDAPELNQLRELSNQLRMLADSEDVFLTERATSARSRRKIMVTSAVGPEICRAAFPERDLLIFKAGQTPVGAVDQRLATYMNGYLDLLRSSLVTSVALDFDRLADCVLL